MSIGTTIKKLRRDRNITQEQLAEMLGVSTNAVSQWECDKTAPDISHLPACQQNKIKSGRHQKALRRNVRSYVSEIPQQQGERGHICFCKGRLPLSGHKGAPFDALI